jgi:hypothetical protein
MTEVVSISEAQLINSPKWRERIFPELSAFLPTENRRRNGRPSDNAYDKRDSWPSLVIADSFASHFWPWHCKFGLNPRS